MRCEIVERADSSTFLPPFQGSIVCRACGANNVCRPFRAQLSVAPAALTTSVALFRAQLSVAPAALVTATRCRTFASACDSLRLNLQSAGNWHVSLS